MSKNNEKIIMFSIAFITIFNYALILFVMTQTITSFNAYHQLFLRFGVGAAISIVSSMYLIKSHLREPQTFSKIIIKLSVAHVPAVLGLILALLLFI